MKCNKTLIDQFPDNEIAELLYNKRDNSNDKISRRAIRALERDNITTLSELLALTQEELMRTPWIGQKGFAMIEERLGAKGLVLPSAYDTDDLAAMANEIMKLSIKLRTLVLKSKRA